MLSPELKPEDRHFFQVRAKKADKMAEATFFYILNLFNSFALKKSGKDRYLRKCERIRKNGVSSSPWQELHVKPRNV
jgi:hypothetical protein